MDPAIITLFATRFQDNLHWVWTFVLFITRFGVLFSVIPGLGMGVRGAAIRYPAVVMVSLAVLSTTSPIPMPQEIGMMIFAIVSEAALGFFIGFVPYLIISGAQLAGQLAGTTMGLSAGNLLDPNLGTPSTEIGKIYGDLLIISYLLSGGHYALISAAASTAGVFSLGTFLSDSLSTEFFARQSGKIFEIGFMLASPVIVALMLTQFVMGLVSKAVPTINLFAISFPLTIGVGLILVMLGLSDGVLYLQTMLADALRMLTG